MADGENRSDDAGAPWDDDGPLTRLIGAIDHVVGVVERIVVAGSVIVMAGLMIANVFGRVLGLDGIYGASEVTEFLILSITFIGLAYGVRTARHISMSAIYDQLAGQWRKGLLVTIALITGALMLFFAYKSFGYTVAIYERGRQSSALGLPLWTIYAILPIGFALSGLQYGLTALRNLTTPGVHRSFTEEEEYASVPVDDAPEEGRGEGRGHL